MTLIEYCLDSKRRLIQEHLAGVVQKDIFFKELRQAAKALNLFLFEKPNGMIIHHTIDLEYEFGIVMMTINDHSPIEMMMNENSLNSIGYHMAKLSLRTSNYE